MSATSYTGNRRYVNNSDQLRCECGWFLSESEVQQSNTGYRWHCERCGWNRRYEIHNL